MTPEDLFTAKELRQLNKARDVLERVPMNVDTHPGFGYCTLSRDGEHHTSYLSAEVDADVMQMMDFESIAAADPEHDWPGCEWADVRVRLSASQRGRVGVGRETGGVRVSAPKYELVPENTVTDPDGLTLHRIRALRPIRDIVVEERMLTIGIYTDPRSGTRRVLTPLYGHILSHA